MQKGAGEAREWYTECLHWSQIGGCCAHGVNPSMLNTLRVLAPAQRSPCSPGRCLTGWVPTPLCQAGISVAEERLCWEGVWWGLVGEP